MVDGFLALAASFFLSPQHRLRKRVNSNASQQNPLANTDTRALNLNLFSPLECDSRTRLLLGCGTPVTHFVDSRLPLRTFADGGGAWPSACHIASSAPASPCDFISAIKQFQWKIAVLSHKWAR